MEDVGQLIATSGTESTLLLSGLQDIAALYSSLNLRLVYFFDM